MLRRMFKIARKALPSGIRQMYYRYQLRKKHGVIPIDPDEEQAIRKTSFGFRCCVSTAVRLQSSTIGDYTRIKYGCNIDNAEIGKFCCVARNAWVGTGPHPTRDFVSTHMFFYAPSPKLGYPSDRWLFNNVTRTVVGHDVWIGTGACVMGGVTIGDGAVIGANSVVTKDVPPYAIYAGMPAKLIGYRFDERMIRLLLAFRWWDRDPEWIREHYRLFADIDRFRQMMEADHTVRAALEREDGTPANAEGISQEPEKAH